MFWIKARKKYKIKLFSFKKSVAVFVCLQSILETEIAVIRQNEVHTLEQFLCTKPKVIFMISALKSSKFQLLL